MNSYGAQGETRTRKIWLLRPTRIPIPSPGQNLERGKRIELSALAWKAKVLPLYEPRSN